MVFHFGFRDTLTFWLLYEQLSPWSHVFILFTGNKRIWGFDLKTPVCIFQDGQIRSLLAFSRSVTLTPLVTPLTPPPCSLYTEYEPPLPSRGHHTSPGKAEPPDYFSSSPTVRVQQQQFLQFLILCWLPEDFQCNVPSQKAKGFNAKLAPLSAYNHRCYIVLCTLYTICLLPPFMLMDFWDVYQE